MNGTERDAPTGELDGMLASAEGELAGAAGVAASIDANALHRLERSGRAVGAGLRRRLNNIE